MDQIEEVRSKIDVVQLISEYLSLVKSGRNFKALCPFHSEKAPSLMVSPERQIWKCFGCGKGGSVFNFLMEMEGMEFGEALRSLAKRAGVKLVSYRPQSDEAERERLYEINHLTSEFYHFLLLSHPVGKKALDYLLGRGIKRESIKLFKLGYSPPLWEGLQKFLVGKKGYKTEDLLKLGLISRQASGYRDFFRDRAVFPLRDHRGNTVGFAGRVVGSWKEEEAAKIGPKYINTPESPLYHKSELLYGLETTRNAIKAHGEAVIVEGELDLISSYQAGVENIVAIKGSALTEAQCRLLKRFCESLILTLDVDVAGDSASRRGIKMADSFGFSVKVARVPEGKDPDELAQKNPQLLRKAIEGAIGVYDFLIQSAMNRFNSQEAEGKRKIGQELIPVLAGLSDEIVKNHYVRLLASKLEVDEEAIMSQIGKFSSVPGPVASSVKPPEEKPKSVRAREELLEEYLLALFFQTDSPQDLLETKIRKLISSSPFRRITDQLESFLKTNSGKFKSEKFARELPSELLEIFNQFYLVDFQRRLENESWVEREKTKTKTLLEELTVRSQLKQSSDEIARMEKEGKGGEIEETKKRFLPLSRRLGKLA